MPLPLPRAGLLASAFLLASLAQAADTVFVNQLGYRPADRKTVVFSQPQTGQNAPSTFEPGASFEVRDATSGTVVLTGSVTAWKAGQVHSQSGDKAWWGDFSALAAPGRYYIQSASGARSPEFSIANGVYNDLLRVAVKSYYFQRCGTALDAAHGDKWTHGVCHAGTGQDTQAQLHDGNAQGDPIDVSGGWHDAGDCRKYVPFTFSVLWELTTAYEWNPAAFGDATGIPESGNGVPDLLDELKWELDWLLKMQRSDGSVYATVGVLASNNDDGRSPDQQTAPRYVTNVNSPAASTVAMAAAKASRLFSAHEAAYPGYAALLRTRAELAWSWLEAHPTNVRYNHAGFAQADANTDDVEDLQRRVAAAAALWRLTGDAKYRVYLENNYNNPAAKSPISKPAKPASDLLLPDSISLAMGMMDYAATPGADPTIVAEFKNAVRNFVDGQLVGNATSAADPYRAYQWDGYYSWGSNLFKSRWAYLGLWAKHLGIGTGGTDYAPFSQEYLHYLLGVNPLGWVYLTNLGPKGANLRVAQSIDEIYHSWFADKSIYDGLAGANIGPAPGFVSGGPSQFYASNTTSGKGNPTSPPANQPPMKSYRNWNTTWPESSWSVTEPAIYYQASFILLASAYVDGP
ncbi:glycoside hydrolase family 9 protein [Nibricoccus sp. IMCC34717]|uniref:glycoside hydrolase family 9 protein n=1 Tax=Nibricoccus sp. IMCC34717 TaxID=3034021 RepID=UPI00384EB7BA